MALTCILLKDFIYAETVQELLGDVISCAVAFSSGGGREMDSNIWAERSITDVMLPFFLKGRVPTDKYFFKNTNAG